MDHLNLVRVHYFPSHSSTPKLPTAILPSPHYPTSAFLSTNVVHMRRNRSNNLVSLREKPTLDNLFDHGKGSFGAFYCLDNSILLKSMHYQALPMYWFRRRPWTPPGKINSSEHRSKPSLESTTTPAPQWIDQNQHPTRTLATNPSVSLPTLTALNG